MANIPLKTIKFPGLDDTYTVPQVDDDLDTAGAAADAKATGDALTEINERLGNMDTATSEDVGKALKVKTVADGKVTEWEFGDTGSQVEIDDTLTQAGEAADAKAAGDAIREVDDILDGLGTWTAGKNKYDKSACNPADNYAYTSNGGYAETTSFATTGKIPVKASTQYTFSAGSTAIKTARYFSGESGDTFISGEDIYSGVFTTPANCTFVAINLFGASHTEEQYNAAMAVAQLELGGVATQYEPYKRILTVSLDSVEDGNKLAGVADAFQLETGKNKYNPAECSPTDNYAYTSNGEYAATTNFANTGKIPVESSTTYVFTAGTAAVKTVRYFSGASGATFISGADINGAFTTPANCTFIAINLFGGSHTSEQYTAAIASAQLEKGLTPTSYEPYREISVLPSENIENGSVLEAVSNVMEEQSQFNMYDKSLAVNNMYVSGATTGASGNYAYTGAVPVKPSTQYNLSADESAPMTISTTIAEFDASGTYLRSKSAQRTQYHNVPFVTDADTYYIKVNMNLDNHTEQDFLDTINTMMLCYGTNRPSTYAPYEKVGVIPNQSLSKAVFDKPDLFDGKKWLAIGTSITWYDGERYQSGMHEDEICRGYVGYVASRKKLITSNLGISGSSLGNINSDSLINRYTSIPWDEADIATIEYGVNDYGANVPLGTADDAAGTSTFAACFKTIIEYALAENPTLRLVICTEPDVRGDSPNTLGKTLKDYTDVTIAIARQYRLPICDWFYASGINDLDRGGREKDWMTIDGTHPTNKGHNRMAGMLNQLFDGLYC